jgi:hypothetical protein
MSNPAPTAITIRTGFAPGDLGMITHLHGVVYAREYGLDTTFEPYVAPPLADLVLGGPDCGQIWIAEQGARTVGSVAIVRSENVGEAQLRWFLITPESRGTKIPADLLVVVRRAARGAASVSRLRLHRDRADAPDAVGPHADRGPHESQAVVVWVNPGRAAIRERPNFHGTLIDVGSRECLTQPTTKLIAQLKASFLPRRRVYPHAPPIKRPDPRWARPGCSHPLTDASPIFYFTARNDTNEPAPVADTAAG